MKFSNEPQSVPKLHAVSQLDWYCLHCGDMRKSQGEIMVHVKAQHTIELEAQTNEQDYARGTVLLLMQLRRERWINEEAEKLSRQLDAARGADDIVLEIELAKEYGRGWGDARGSSPEEA